MSSILNIGPPMNQIICIVIPAPSATVIPPMSASDEESFCRDFSLSLEMTVRSNFQGLFELLSAKMP